MIAVNIPRQAAQDPPAAMAAMSKLLHALILERPREPSIPCALAPDRSRWALDAEQGWIASIAGGCLTIHAIAQPGTDCPLDRRIDERVVAAAAWACLWLAAARHGLRGLCRAAAEARR